MLVLNVNNVSKSYGFGDILNKVSFTINEGEKVAIVGLNGAGKSTLLKIIAGIETCKSGDISFKKGTKLEYLEQGDNADVKQGKCGEILNSAFDFLRPIEAELKNFESQMACDPDQDKLDVLIKRYCALQEKFITMGGYDVENQVNYVVNGLKIDKSLLEREFNTLSGGERTLINFAKILISKLANSTNNE